MTRLASIAVAALLAIGAPMAPLAPAQTVGATTPEPAPTFTAEQWREDLDQLVRELPEKHLNAFSRRSRDDFEAQAAKLRADLDAMTDTDRALALSRLVASLGDGHTMIDITPYQVASPLFPIGLMPASDGFLIAAAPSSSPEMLGCELVAINDVPMAEVLDRLATLYSWENRATKEARLRQWLAMGEAHRFLGITPSAEEATVSFRALEPGAPIQTAVIAGVPRADMGVHVTPLSRPTPGVAELSRRRDNRAMWFDFVPGEPIMYLRYDRCADDRQMSIRQYTDSVLLRLDAGGVERLIIDLRANGGGNSALLNPFINALAKRPVFKERGSLIVLTGRDTYSSAQLNADALRRNAGAVVIGGPTGQKPNAYGEVRSFTLKNTGLPVYYSTKFFKTDQDDPESMMPDVLIEPTMADLAAGRDVVLEAAVEFKP